MALARMARKSFSAGCAEPRLGIITIAGVYLGRYASEAAWRDDHRRMSNGEQFRAVAGLVAKNAPSVDFCGYWQRAIVS
jgi:hypothetical protein